MTLKQYLLHQLREIRREMLVAIEGLSAEDLTSHEPGGHSPIAWIVQHCVLNVDYFIHRAVTERLCLHHDRQFLTWPLIEPQPGDEYPPLGELVERWTTVLNASLAALESIPEERLQEPSPTVTEPLVESCLRVTNHQNNHLRQIWCILGRRHVDSRFPDQQTWLA